MDEHDLTKHIWIQKLKDSRASNEPNKSAIKTQIPKRKTATQGVWNPITNCTRIVQDQLNKVHRLDLPNSTPKQSKN